MAGRRTYVGLGVLSFGLILFLAVWSLDTRPFTPPSPGAPPSHGPVPVVQVTRATALKAPVQGGESPVVETTPLSERVAEDDKAEGANPPRPTTGWVRFRFDLSRLAAEVQETLGRKYSATNHYPRIAFSAPSEGGEVRFESDFVPIPIPEGGFLIYGVLPGTYAVRLTGCGPTVPLIAEPEQVTVECGKETACVLTPTSAQCLALDVKDGEGRAVTGTLEARIFWGPSYPSKRGRWRDSRWVKFLAEPYVLLFTAEGSVDVQVTIKGYRETMAAATAVAGRVSRCEVWMEKE